MRATIQRTLAMAQVLPIPHIRKLTAVPEATADPSDRHKVPVWHESCLMLPAIKAQL